MKLAGQSLLSLLEGRKTWIKPPFLWKVIHLLTNREKPLASFCPVCQFFSSGFLLRQIWQLFSHWLNLWLWGLLSWEALAVASWKSRWKLKYGALLPREWIFESTEYWLNLLPLGSHFSSHLVSGSVKIWLPQTTNDTAFASHLCPLCFT